jgi:hypothetical protein
LFVVGIEDNMIKKCSFGSKYLSVFANNLATEGCIEEGPFQNFTRADIEQDQD